MKTNKYDSIVVGGGIAGLTAAAYLARDKQKVLLIEKNDKCGGLISSFEVNGFRFESGARALENTGVVFPMLEDLNIQLEFVDSPVSIGVADDIMTIKDLTSLDEYGEFLKRNYPDSMNEVDGLIKVIRKIMKHMEVLYGIENPAFKDLKNDREFLFKKLLPWLPKFILTMGKINRLNMPVEEFLEERISNPSLRDIITQHFFKHTPTFFALSYFSLYLDYYYPIGGVGQLPKALEMKFREWNGELLLNTSVNAVNPQQKTIADDRGNTYQYNQMIWAADLKHLYTIVEDSNMPNKHIERFNRKKQDILSKRGSDSVFSLYLQVDEPVATFGKVAQGHFFYTPSKKGLGTVHTDQLDEILTNWDQLSKEKIMAWLEDFTALNTYEVSIPVMKDPNAAPEGKTGIILSFLAEYDLFVKVRDSGWYDQFVAVLEEKMIATLDQSIYPGLKDKIIDKFSFTPLSYARRVGSSEGAIVGWSFREPVPAAHKIQSTDKSTLTALPDVYQCGQWAFSPAGVPTAILTGKLAADRVVKQRKKNKLGS